jgi:hypothetical protein
VSRLLVAALGLSLVAVLGASPAGTSPARDTLIRPGVGIGKVRLGMTAAQAKRAMGRPHDTGWSERRDFGQRYLELVWDSGPEDSFAVGLLGSGDRLRVVSMWTTRPSERVPAGVGPGSSRQKVLGTLHGLRCQDVYRRDGSGHLVRTELVLGSSRGPQTVFVPGNWRFYDRDTGKFIAYVIVRQPATEPELRFVAVRCR